MMKPLGVQSCKKDLDPGPGNTHIHMLNLTAESRPDSEVKRGCQCNTVAFSVSVVLLAAMGRTST